MLLERVLIASAAAFKASYRQGGKFVGTRHRTNHGGVAIAFDQRSQMKLAKPPEDPTIYDTRHNPVQESIFKLLERLEASAGIEPAFKDLQSSASPLRHEAVRQYEGE